MNSPNKNSLGDRPDSSVYVEDLTYLHGFEERLVVIMLGLPARGKSYISKKLRRYLEWIGYTARVFNVGDRRRLVADTKQDASFFDPNSKDMVNVRDRVALDVLDELIDWTKKTRGGRVGIHDATNCTKKRREQLLERLKSETTLNVLFIESICNDTGLIEVNIGMKTKSPDYKNVTKEEAMKDFHERLKNYELAYQELGSGDDDKPYIKLIDVGRQVLANKISGYLPSQIVTFLMNYHIQPRSIWLTRHGESIANTQGILGGDSELSEEGHVYAAALSKFGKKPQIMLKLSPINTY
eukprot:TRINITY_DN3499_c0_g1_i3.p1 TRINITY_DN3499_c0_g1~~TRINITY_DN3499_c0_g1_i3.p1  ORF type:complete len:297 (-),score=65.55 TRINITY_DN3499_c0_g1_i3:844-1734(-)